MATNTSLQLGKLRSLFKQEANIAAYVVHSEDAHQVRSPKRTNIRYTFRASTPPIRIKGERSYLGLQDQPVITESSSSLFSNLHRSCGDY